MLLAVPFAVWNLMPRGECLPIVMDDPFVYFEPTQCRSAMYALKQFANRYHMVVLTCNDHPKIAAERKVELKQQLTLRIVVYCHSEGSTCIYTMYG